MQLRKLLNDNPGLTTAISTGLLLVALGVVGYHTWPRGATAPPPPEHRAECDAEQCAPGCPIGEASCPLSPQ